VKWEEVESKRVRERERVGEVRVARESMVESKVSHDGTICFSGQKTNPPCGVKAKKRSSVKS
jgi:hypothetical protein